MSNVRIAAVQAAPVFMDRDATVAKAAELIAEAAAGGARLVVFPEAYVPTYPDAIWTMPPGDSDQWSRLHAEYIEQSVVIPSPATGRLCAAARSAGVYVAAGVSERDDVASRASLYNTLLYIDPQGEILGKHRKLVPTAAERMVWAQGGGDTLAAYDTELGVLGGLICWENYMPLARYAMYAWGVQIYLAPTWDRGDGWLATMRHIAQEGRTYVVGCCMALHLDDIPDRYAFKRLYAPGTQWINVGDSVIVAPDGKVIAGPLHEEYGILYADADLDQVRQGKWMLDVAGHYARPDVFHLEIDQRAHPMLRTVRRPTGAATQPARGEDEAAET